MKINPRKNFSQQVVGLCIEVNHLLLINKKKFDVDIKLETILLYGIVYENTLRMKYLMLMKPC